MKILLVSMRHTYGESDRELSFEYFNFYLVLISMGHEVELFDYMSELRTVGKAAMNIMLLDKVRGWRPHLTLFSLYTDQFDPLAVDALRKYTKTFCFFQYYNNNYRPIYHLENFLLYVATLIHDF